MVCKLQREINLYKKKLLENPENKDLLYNLAMLYLNNNNIDEAYEISEKLIVKDIFNPEYQNLKGLLLQRKNKITEAAEYFNKAVEISSDNLDYFNNLAIVYALSGDYENAENVFERAVKKGEDPNIYLNYAIFLYNIDNFFKASEYFEKTLNKNYFTENFYSNYTNFLIEVKNYSKAEDLLEKGLKLFPENIDLKINSAILCKDKSKNSKLSNLINEAEPRLLKNILKKLCKAENWKNVSSVSKQLLKLESDNKTALKNLALANYNAGNFEKTIKIYNNLIILFPGDTEILIEFSDLLKELGQFDFSLKLIEQAIINDPENEIIKQKKEKLFFLSENKNLLDTADFSIELKPGSDILKIGVLIQNPDSRFAKINLDKFKEVFSFVNDEVFQFILLFFENEKPDYEFLNKNNIEFRLVKNIEDLQKKIQKFDLLISYDNVTEKLLRESKMPIWLILPVISDIDWKLKEYSDKPVKIVRQKTRFFWKDVTEEITFELLKRLNQFSVPYLMNKALELTNRKKYDEAVELYKKIITKEENCEAYFRLGYISGIKNEYETAIGYYYSALELSPNDLNIFSNIGTIFKDMKKFSESESVFQSALELYPENEFLLNNTAIVKCLLGKFNEAQFLLEKALQINIKFPRTYVNMAVLYQSKNKNNLALKALEKALELQPDDPLSHFNYACCLLKKKNFSEGFKHYEWRKKMEKYIPRIFPRPELCTKNIEGKKIYVYDEQGFGDTIQFARYLKPLKNNGAEVYFECHTSLISLFEKQNYIDSVFSAKQKMYEKLEYDYVISLLSLPLYFGISYDTVNSSEAYIQIRKEEAYNTEYINIGFVWKGRLPVNNLRRAVNLTNFEPLFRKANLKFHSIQKDNISSKEKEILQKYKIIDYSNELYSFLETAKIISKMDLIITIDTSVAHLAGAIGKTVWLLLPFNSDWRWFEDKTSIWYPDMKIFRQKSYSDWKNVFVQVNKELNVISK